MTMVAEPSGGDPTVAAEEATRNSQGPANTTVDAESDVAMLQREVPAPDGGDELLAELNMVGVDIDDEEDESVDGEFLAPHSSVPVDGASVDGAPEAQEEDVPTPPTSASDATPLKAETDGFGMKGYLSMRDEGLTYRRMKRFYCRCVGVNFSRFATRDSASSLINAAFSAEIHKVESWDGKGLWHTYRNSFKLYFTTGAVFNVDADSEDDKKNWLAYIQAALRAGADASDQWRAHAETYPSVMLLSLGGLAFTEKKHSRPTFKNAPACSHPNCGMRFDSAKRQHHCRNCGGSMCSDHSFRFAALRHYGLSNSVRLCTGCYRVQRFMVCLSMLVQRVSAAQAEGGAKKPALSKADEEEVEAVVAMFSDSAFGISDLIQVLHLHRHGCDEAYAHVVSRLLELSATQLPDFEFFLPQLFQMWLTIDWARNNIKAALLFRVICYAAQLHIRFATAIYWLARAAVDDSCGWGFGQSELLIPEYLFRKFSFCKLLMVNLEMQISQREWTFRADRDLPAPELQAQMVTCLFDRLHVLVRLSPQKVTVSPLGELCDAITACAVPLEFLHLLALPPHVSRSLAIPSRNIDGEIEWRVFNTQIKFVEELCDMTERLRHCAPDQRKAALKLELQKLELPDEAFCPIGSCEDPLQRFITIARNEGTVFTTRARAPTLVFFEVEILTYLAGKSHWMQRARSATASTLGASASELPRIDSVSATNPLKVPLNGSASDSTGSKNAIEVATSSDIGQALELNTLREVDGALSSAVASKADEDKHAIVSLNGSRANMLDEEELDPEELEESRDRVASNPPPTLVAPGVKKPVKLRRRRSGSLVTSTTKSLDSIISACSETLSSRRKRSASEGEVLDVSASAQRNSSPLFNEVEKFTADQLTRMAQNLEVSMLEDAPASCGVFTGKDVVSWMTQNELVFDEAHALWLGGELMDSGAIELAQAPASTVAASSSSNPSPVRFTGDESVTYRLRSASTTIRSKSPRNPAELVESAKLLTVSSPIGSPHPVPSSSQTLSAHTGAISTGTHSEDGASGSPRLSSSMTSSDMLQRQSSAYNADTSNVSGEDDQHSTSASPSHKGVSFMEKFKPDEALRALRSVEDALETHVFACGEADELEAIRADLATLKEQVEIVHGYVLDKRKQHHIAKESAFGESFEEKRERLRESSSHLPLCQSEGWDCVAFIVKSNDDLRQEVLCLQLIRQLQDIFQSAELPLRLLPYGIIATSASTGMIEYIKNATSLDALKKRHGYTTLAHHFVRTYGEVDSPAYKTAMTNFVRSMAAYSLACYFLQIKDRHNGNIMIDSDGHVVHIDFGFILGIAPGGRFSLETAPFKLTAEMVDAMGGTQSEYFKAYVIFLIQGFLALQQHADTILMMIAIMAQESSCPCFLSQNPRDILSATKRLFQLNLDQSLVIKHVLQLVRRSHNSYRTRQYDVFQRMTNGILP